jgi:predicted aspartyl protease
MGRFSAEFEVANHEDVIRAKDGNLAPDQVRRAKLSGVVDTGATRLVLPASIVATLGLPQSGPIGVQYADGRRDQKMVVGDVQLEILGRSSVFTAVVEPNRQDVLIGAIVLEELDLIPDCTLQRLVPRDPKQIFAELD